MNVQLLWLALILFVGTASFMAAGESGNYLSIADPSQVGPELVQSVVDAKFVIRPVL